MPIEEFRDIFRREIDSHLTRLQRKSCGPSVISTPCRSPSSTMHLTVEAGQDSTLNGGPELANLAELRRLADSMVESIMQRLGDHAAYWGLEAAAATGESAEATEAAAAAAEGSAAREELEARCRALEEELLEKRQEEARRSAELLEKYKAEYTAVLEARELDLLEVRKAAAMGPPTDAAAALQSDTAEELRHQLAERVSRIRSLITATKDTVQLLDARKKGLELVEAQQRRALPHTEALLASVGADSAVGAQDRALLETLRQGEQVCKRMRRQLTCGT